MFPTWDSAGHWHPLRVRVTKPRMLSRRPQPRMILGQAGQPCQTAAVILLISANISDQSNLENFLALDTALHDVPTPPMPLYRIFFNSCRKMFAYCFKVLSPVDFLWLWAHQMRSKLSCCCFIVNFKVFMVMWTEETVLKFGNSELIHEIIIFSFSVTKLRCNFVRSLLNAMHV